jgi:hypothetical protein
MPDQHGRELDRIAVAEQGDCNDPAEFGKEALISGVADTRIPNRSIADRALDVSAVAYGVQDLA